MKTRLRNSAASERSVVGLDDRKLRLVFKLRQPLGGKLYEPKLTPHEVTDEPPDVAASHKLTRATTGATYEKLGELGPSMVVTRTKADSHEPDPLAL